MLRSALLAASHQDAFLQQCLRGFTQSWDLPKQEMPNEQNMGHRNPCSPNPPPEPATEPSSHIGTNFPVLPDNGKPLPVPLPSALCLVCVDSKLFRDETGDLLEVPGTGELQE